MSFSFQVVLKPQLINGPHRSAPPGRSVDDENPFHSGATKAALAIWTGGIHQEGDGQTTI